MVEFAPELYPSHEMAIDEAHRWAWLLSGDGSSEVKVPFEGRIKVGIRDIRVVEIDSTSHEGAAPWVGSFWTSYGYPDPEAVLLLGRMRAEEWVTSPISGLSPMRVESSQWHIAATFVIRGEEAYAVAHKAKEICAAKLVH